MYLYYIYTLCSAIMEAGAELGIGHAGTRVINTLRIEKGEEEAPGNWHGSCDRAVCRVPRLGPGDEQGRVAHRGRPHALRQDEEEGPHCKYSRGHVYFHVCFHVYCHVLFPRPTLSASPLCPRSCRPPPPAAWPSSGSECYSVPRITQQRMRRVDTDNCDPEGDESVVMCGGQVGGTQCQVLRSAK